MNANDFEINFDPKALVINFTEPKHSIDKKIFVKLLLHLADNSLIHGHRNSEWCGHAPVIEQDIALANISLDYIGQARILYQYAAFIINTYNIEGYKIPATEDTLAYLRLENQYYNYQLLELPKGDWSFTIGKQYFFSVLQKIIFEQLSTQNVDTHLKAMANKFLKEIDYHKKWSADWVLRLGDGTELSHTKMQNTLHELAPYISEFFALSEFETLAQNHKLLDYTNTKHLFYNEVNNLLASAQLELKNEDGFIFNGGKQGIHTEYMGQLLTELQYMQRTYPNMDW